MYESTVKNVNDCISKNCQLDDNGGAIYILESVLEMSKNTFLNTRCEFNNCSAKYVGAIFLYYGYADRNIIGCRFNKCISTDNYISGIGIFNRSNNFGNDNIFSECVNPIGNVTDTSYF